MARPAKSFQDQAKDRYDQINGEIEKLEEDLQGLRAERKSIATYLQSVGAIEKVKRGQRKKK